MGYYDEYSQMAGYGDYEKENRILFSGASPDDLAAGYQFYNTDYWNEFYAAYTNFAHQMSMVGSSYITGAKANRARQELVSAYYDTVSKLAQSMREREQGSVSSQVEQLREAGRNPALEGVDAAGAASAGSGIQTSLSPDFSSMPDAESAFQVVGDIVSVAASVVGTVVSAGVGIAGLVANVGRIAAQNLLTEEQVKAIAQGRQINAGLIAEQFVLDNAPQYDEEIGDFPGWKIDAIPGVDDDLQEYALQRANSYYGSERHRSGQLSYLSASEQSRSDLAYIYGSGFYSNNLQEMSANIAGFSKVQLDAIDSAAKREKEYNDLYAKYFQLLSPEAMSEVQNKVLAYSSEYYSTLSGEAAANAVNLANASQADFFKAYDSGAAANAQDALNRYNSELYQSLSPESKAAYDNLFYDLSVLKGNIVSDEIKAQDALYAQVRSGLNSLDPAVRIQSAKALQRLKAKSDARSSMTGWQRFSNGARTVAGIGAVIGGAVVAGMGSPALGAGVAGVGVGSMPTYTSSDTAYGLGGFTGW